MERQYRTLLATLCLLLIASSSGAVLNSKVPSQQQLGGISQNLPSDSYYERIKYQTKPNLRGDDEDPGGSEEGGNEWNGNDDGPGGSEEGGNGGHGTEPAPLGSGLTAISITAGLYLAFRKLKFDKSTNTYKA